MTDREGMLTPYRVLDATTAERGLTGMLLAQLGAEVILLEPPGGLARDTTFDAYHRGKQSLVATSPADITSLAATADVVITDHSLDALPDLATLRDADPALVTVALTPWGSTGPKASWKATDLILFAASGQLSCTGDEDRPPVRISVPQAWGHATCQAAVGTLIALEDRVHTGLGQHVDVSALRAVAETALPANYWAPAGLPAVERIAGGVKFGQQKLKMVHRCLDGWVVVTISFGPMIGPMVGRFVDWMFEEGACDQALRDNNWIDFALDISEGRVPLSELERLIEAIGAFVANKSKTELQERSLTDILLVSPVNTIQDVLESPQLAARDFWDIVDGEQQPGAIFHSSQGAGAPLPPAPALGAHRDAITTSPRPVPLPTPQHPAPADRRPLEGIRVCDLAWVAAAPITTKTLAHWGAEVIRIESSARPCLLRQALGHRDDVADQEGGVTWHAVNANKYGVALNLAVPESIEVVKDLVAVSDIVLESFTPGSVGRWGLGYDDLKAIKPDIIMASSCVMGQTGPMRRFAGFGNLSAAVAGFFDITGWPDRLPAGPYMAYTDYTSPRFTAMALLTALDHRRRTGEGQYIDFSQMEAATHLLTPALLEYQRTGHMVTRDGNRDPHMTPHGVYPGAGHDTWIAIAVQDDEQWRLLAKEMRHPDLADLTFAERREREDEIDEALSAWTSHQPPGGLQHRLQVLGIPAHQVSRSEDVINDPQMVHDGYFTWAPHPDAGSVMVDGMAYDFSRSQGGVQWGGPTYGQHTMEIFERVLGYDTDRITEIAISGALE